MAPKATPRPHSTRRRARWVVAVVSTAVLGAAACGPTDDSVGATDPTTGASRATAPVTTAPPTTRARRTFTVAGVGDILLHFPVNQSAREHGGGTAWDYRPMFDGVRDRISGADFAICHKEGVISADDTNLTQAGTKVFNSPRSIAEALADAGFDACDTASNHTWDRGAAGVRDTLDALDAAGVGHAGASRSAEEAANPPIYDVKGVQLGHMAYSYTIPNSGSPTTTVPESMPWLREMLWPVLGVEGILEHARAIRERGAEFVVVSMHWGDEYVTRPNATQRQMARQLLESPEIDLILGDHVHVVQPCEKINDKYVIYGMGNFLSNQSPTQAASLRIDTEDGTLNTFTVEEVSPGTFRTTRYEVAPTRVERPGHRIVEATPDRYLASYNRTVAAVNLLNETEPGACDPVPAF
jgi:poly-gamma-glutamate capsule biosynthesis protein CapA/YwtB (metallophosphatase superfamily)